jgi:deoxyribodipyrimidine photo-lyase
LLREEAPLCYPFRIAFFRQSAPLPGSLGFSMPKPSAVILWFRQDLRLGDNPACSATLASNLPVIPVYIWHPTDAGEWAMGAAAQVWLQGSLQALTSSLKALGSNLILQQGPTAAALIQLAKAADAQQVHCNARYEPWARAQQTQVQAELAVQGITLVIHRGGALLWEPDAIATLQGKPYQVFTPYFNRCLQQLPEFNPLPSPARLPAPAQWPPSLGIEDLRLLPSIPWDTEIRASWQPGEAAAHQRVQDFLAESLVAYSQARNMPSQTGTSRFSPHLAHGEISPRQIWHAVETFTEASDRSGNATFVKKAAPVFLREIVWREFAYHVLYHFPHTTQQPLKEKFRAMPWVSNPTWLNQWGQGQTGYPLVDAGMRQLWRTGWMHNRVRMVVGSFLTKDLLIPWQDGARWFWDTLIDADLAVNSLNWQWVAGSGADAQPFFRIFNPTGQSEKFDPTGDYIRHWVPELSDVTAPAIHAPWKAKPNALRLAKNYPPPMVDHAEARDKALHVYRTISPEPSAF